VARIKINDIPKNLKISRTEMRKVLGGVGVVTYDYESGSGSGVGYLSYGNEETAGSGSGYFGYGYEAGGGGGSGYLSSRSGDSGR